MGLFDYIHCEYPLPNGGDSQREFQTKSIGYSYMNIYKICSEGKLWKKEKEAWFEILAYRGEIIFGDLENDYSALFNKGKVIDIVEIRF